MTAQYDQNESGIDLGLLKQRDPRVFALFVSRFQNMVFACGRALGLNDHDVEDAAADTFLAAWQALPRFKHGSKLSSWLWSIAYHKAIDHRRKRTDYAPLDDSMQTPAQQSPSLGPVEQSEQDNRLWQTVRRLSVEQAAAILLYYREDKSIEDIASILDMPPNTVKTHLYRGRKELYNQLHTIWETEYVR